VEKENEVRKQVIRAKDIMTKDVVAVKEGTSLKELAQVLYEKRINGVPVIDDKGKLIGIICESDLIRKDTRLHIPTVVALFDWVLYLERPKKMEEEIARINATQVKDLYTQEVVTVGPETPVEEIATLMTEKKFYTIPVVEGDRMVGIIGKADVIGALVP
jgi:CBS-domain-containing membrane protein